MVFTNDVEAVDALRKKYADLTAELHKVIVGQDDIIKNVLISVLSGGHCLLIGVPGLAKTMLVNAIANTLGLDYKRIQFTPDLMPSDIIGTEILDHSREFKFIKGPVFANIILADEINRTPPKTQSALLEAMQEKAVTAAGIRYVLEEPFFVLATQNPIEQEGTYPLPEAQLDRFMFSLLVNYPSYDEEVDIVRFTTSANPSALNKMMTGEEIIFYQQLMRKVPVNDSVIRYAVELVSKTRPGTALSHKMANDFITWGAGPRASQYLITGAKAHALIEGKYSPDIDDVIAVAHPVLRHRLVRNYKAEAENITNDDIISRLIQS